MSTYTISGNAVAVKARLRLINLNFVEGASIPMTYTDNSGDYTFLAVPVGSYKIVADLVEASAPYNTGYSYRSAKLVQVVANNLAAVNFSPTSVLAAS